MDSIVERKNILALEERKNIWFKSGKAKIEYSELSIITFIGQNQEDREYIIETIERHSKRHASKEFQYLVMESTEKEMILNLKEL